MGLFARLVCLRQEGSASDLARTVIGLLRARSYVEVADPAQAERLLLIAQAGPGWLTVFDHIESPSAAMEDADGLLSPLSGSPGATALDILVADSDDLVLTLMDGGVPQAHLAIGHQGLQDGAVEPWQRLLRPGQSVDDIRKAFGVRKTFVEEHFPALKPLFGIDFAAFNEIGKAMSGQPGRRHRAAAAEGRRRAGAVGRPAAARGG
jgi:hypothetical protein